MQSIYNTQEKCKPGLTGLLGKIVSYDTEVEDPLGKLEGRANPDQFGSA